jgi:hypothetical protein
MESHFSTGIVYGRLLKFTMLDWLESLMWKTECRHFANRMCSVFNLRQAAKNKYVFFSPQRNRWHVHGDEYGEKKRGKFCIDEGLS